MNKRKLKWIRKRYPDGAEGQISKAEYGDWTLKAVAWSSYFEAKIIYIGEQIASDPRSSAFEDEELGAKTRLEAELRAEALLVKWIKEQYKLIKDLEALKKFPKQIVIDEVYATRYDCNIMQGEPA